MKKFAVAVLCLFLLAPSTFAAEKPTPKADPSAAAHKDTKFLLNYMKQTREDFLKSIKGLSEAQWKYKALPDRWSIAETAEHITLTEDFLRDIVENKVMKSPAASPEDKAKANVSDEELIKMVTDRSKKVQAPEPLKPTNKWANAKEIEKAFKEKRDFTMKYTKATPEAQLREHVAPYPLGTLDGYQWLVLLSAHTKRHTLQIEEVKADARYPKK
jgi:hypothetical protein